MGELPIKVAFLDHEERGRGPLALLDKSSVTPTSRTNKYLKASTTTPPFLVMPNASFDFLI